MEILVPISLFATAFGVLYMYFTTRHRERIALIEKGAEASIFTSERKDNRFYSLQLGILGVGVGAGILMGHILNESFGLREEVAYNAMIFLMGGISLILFHLINLKQYNSQNNK